jgi:hypothetical protein
MLTTIPWDGTPISIAGDRYVYGLYAGNQLMPLE